MSTEKCQSELIESANWVRGFFDEESRFKAADASVSILLTEYRQAAYHAARLAKIALFDGKSRDKAIYAEAAARTLERALSLMLRLALATPAFSNCLGHKWRLAMATFSSVM